MSAKLAKIAKSIQVFFGNSFAVVVGFAILAMTS